MKNSAKGGKPIVLWVLELKNSKKRSLCFARLRFLGGGNYMAIQSNEDFSLGGCNNALFADEMKSKTLVINAVEKLTDLEKHFSNLFETPNGSPQGFAGNLGEMKCGRYLKYKGKAPDFWVGAWFDGFGNFDIRLSIFEGGSSPNVAQMLKSKGLNYSFRHIVFNPGYTEDWYTVSLPKSLIFKSSADLKDEIDKIII